MASLLQDYEPDSEDMAEVLRHEFEAHINRNLQNPGLGWKQIASIHHVSVQTVQRLFAGTGHGLTGLIRKAHLRAVHRDLADYGTAHLTITEAGAKWCIHDAQWLAKAFKTEFGLTPSEFRKSAAAGISPDTGLVNHGPKAMRQS
ncbi:helix-turn-helix domain-containing protein [Arthrobacter sp. SAFR-179]|uniref:helix-turn-helix domain-containing protein n=1 Tax=Arthrobacter sp. SAFR-179 TaxID=3387279 RepID=UPI003F7C5757